MTDRENGRSALLLRALADGFSASCPILLSEFVQVLFELVVILVYVSRLRGRLLLGGMDLLSLAAQLLPSPRLSDERPGHLVGLWLGLPSLLLSLGLIVVLRGLVLVELSLDSTLGISTGAHEVELG